MQLGPIKITRCPSPHTGQIGTVIETYNRRVHDVIEPICIALDARDIRLVPRGKGGDMIGIWPICPKCALHQFMLASEYNEEAVICPRCGAEFRIRGIQWPYTMVT